MHEKMHNTTEMEDLALAALHFAATLFCQTLRNALFGAAGC